jgi:hypothetical protein
MTGIDEWSVELEEGLATGEDDVRTATGHWILGPGCGDDPDHSPGVGVNAAPGTIGTHEVGVAEAAIRRRAVGLPP